MILLLVVLASVALWVAYGVGYRHGARDRNAYWRNQLDTGYYYDDEEANA